MTTCPRCGSPVKPLADLHMMVRRITGRAVSARDALGAMHGWLPAVVPAALVDLEVTLELIGERIACHAGTCDIPGQRNRAHNPVSAPAPCEPA